eukprot:Pgem_evm1s14244
MTIEKNSHYQIKSLGTEHSGFYTSIIANTDPYKSNAKTVSVSNLYTENYEEFEELQRNIGLIEGSVNRQSRKPSRGSTDIGTELLSLSSSQQVLGQQITADAKYETTKSTTNTNQHFYDNLSSNSYTNNPNHNKHFNNDNVASDSSSPEPPPFLKTDINNNMQKSKLKIKDGVDGGEGNEGESLLDQIGKYGKEKLWMRHVDISQCSTKEMHYYNGLGNALSSAIDVMTDACRLSIFSKAYNSEDSG